MNKTERIAKTRELLTKEIDSVLASTDVESIKSKVTELLNKGMKESILHALGLNTGWDRFTVTHDSPLKHKMVKAVSELMEEIQFTKPVLDDKLLATLQRLYDREYIDAIKKNISKSAEQAAMKDLTVVLEQLK